MTEPIYRVTDLVRVFRREGRDLRAVDRVGLQLDAGTRLGIVGESGSGKSTLVRLMAALDRPTSGSITFQGTEITELAERKLGMLRSRVQMVFQDPRSSLNPRMKVADIITEPLRSPLLRRRSDVPTDARARLAEVLDQVGLPADSGHRFPHEFSGGQRQRIAIARALAPRPSVLIADEPVSALDVSVRGQVLNLLRDLVADQRLTMVFVSHDLAVVRHVCDQVAVMKGGRILEQGPIGQVFGDPGHPYTAQLLAAVPRVRTGGRAATGWASTEASGTSP